MLPICDKMFNALKLLRNDVALSAICRNKCIKAKNLSKGPEAATKKSFGQPAFETHPHLIGKNEVLPLITPKELQRRRQTLVEYVIEYSMKNKPDLKEHVIVIPSASKSYMSDKIPYVFRQNSDYLYLSGCQEPDTCLVLTSVESPGQHESILFVRDRDTNSEIWDGPRTSPEDAVHLFGVSQSYPIQELMPYMKSFLANKKPIILWYDFMNPTQVKIQNIMKEYINAATTKIWDSPKQYLHRQRLIKSPAEIELMKRSCDIASSAIINCIKASKPGIKEHELYARVEFDCKMGGAEMLAYPPVIAGGERGTIIHYINNNQVVRDGEMVLMDAGCEYHGYSSDITRTWPVNGKFTKVQQDLYEAVLNVQTELLAALVEMPTLDKLFDKMCMALGRNLQELGLISKSYSKDALMRAAYQFCPHHVSHYLGMDVHDTSLIPRNFPIQPGMIITIEPGVYVSPQYKVPREFTGIGIRIEDDVLITEKGPVVLTSKCPKSVSDLVNIFSYENSRV